MSILIVTQKFNLLPLRFRTILTSLYIFNTQQLEFNHIWKELCGDKKDVKAQILQAMANMQPHEFLFIRLHPLKYFINFKQILPINDLITKIQAGAYKLQTQQEPQQTPQQTPFYTQTQPP